MKNWKYEVKNVFDEIFCLDESLRLDCQYEIWLDESGELKQLEVLEAECVRVCLESGEVLEKLDWAVTNELEAYLKRKEGF